ncbi:UPF0606 protein KIAA1549 isoform X2 [Gouania willdenowi]|uniref:UPF0606 protein KIAA1549 isoform X2 n=1 Tax=Gouania willdenowi TaxID=441366 RepID=UPI0010566E81|nr:UPF0606 protein KIAA1549-like isoform X2 [Gouania willdenowi]
MRCLDFSPRTMAGSVTVGPLVMLKGHVLTRFHRVLLWITVLVVVITMDSTVADQPQHYSMQFLRHSTGSSPSTLPASLEALLSVSEPINESRTTGSHLYKQHFVTNKKSKSPIQRPAPVEETQTTPTTPPSALQGFGQQSDAQSKGWTDWKRARTNSNHYSISPAPTISLQQTQLNASVAALAPFAFTRSTTDLDLITEGKESFSINQEGEFDHTLAVTLKPHQPLESPKQDFPDFLADEPYRNIARTPQLSSSSATLKEKINKTAHGVKMHEDPNEILSPSYNVPFISPHPTTPFSGPTDGPEDFYPTDTIDFYWGSGDYLETMSFNSERDDYSLATKVPSNAYDLDDYTETYDTSFPSRVGISLSSMFAPNYSQLPSLKPTHITISPTKSFYTSSSSNSVDVTLEPTPMTNTEMPDVSDVDWAETFTIHPTAVLLPDMNSLEYYTNQLSKENSSETRAEHRGNITVVSISTTKTTSSDFATDTVLSEEDFVGDLSGFEPQEESTPAPTTEETLHTLSDFESVLNPSVASTHILDSSPSFWSEQMSFTTWTTSYFSDGKNSAVSTEALQHTATPLLPNDLLATSSLTDVHWFVTEYFPGSNIQPTSALTPTMPFTHIMTEPNLNVTGDTADLASFNDSFTTKQTPVDSTESTSFNDTSAPPFVLNDQEATEEAVSIQTTITLIQASTIVNTPTSTTATTTFHQASTSLNIISTADGKTAVTPVSRQFLCNINRPVYLTKVGFSSGVTVGHAKAQIKDILKKALNKSLELQVVNPPPKFVFRVVSGPIVYTPISVVNALRRSFPGRRFLSVSINWTVPSNKYQVHTVLQFVPDHVDVRFCNFSESIENGLTMAFAEVRRRAKESTNFTVQIVNITMAALKYEEQQLLRQPVDITFTVRGSRGYLTGSEVSDALMKLTMVEFSYYMGFPVQQIAEPFHYPMLNKSQLLRSSWVKTVLLGVLDQKVGERTFQANIERRVAMLLGEAMGSVRRVKRATNIGNNSVQIVSSTRLDGAENPLELIYFVEGPEGQRIPAIQTADLLNSLDIQRAAIILGYRVLGVLAQPVEKVTSPLSDTANTNLWIIIGVVLPLLVVIIIISILYWKLCRTDKLEFQPDAMTAIQQRQKLQTPSVKGFDFAKLHLGQPGKDDVMVIQESVPSEPGPGPLALPINDGFSPSENGTMPAPVTKASVFSTKASRTSRRRERISPSDGDSVVSDRSSEWDSTEDNLRAHAMPGDRKPPHKVPINVLNSPPPPPMNGTNEQLSSAAIFEHVDRMSRSTDANRRLPNKVQLIAMQPMPVLPLHSPPTNGKLADTNPTNKEVPLRHKSEIEHHRNKIRLRAKRKGHYDFPAMEDVTGDPRDVKDPDHIYQKADKMMDTDAQMPCVFVEPKKSGRGRRSPKQKAKEQLNGGIKDADKDKLITDELDVAHRKCPGVNNVAYVCDPDQGQRSPHRSPSPMDDVFLGPASSPPGHAPPPPPYMPPQPSIEEARQQMHSLLDDAFSLVSPTSQSSSAGITLPGVNSHLSGSSPPGRGPRPWATSFQPLSPFPNRFTELSISSPSVQGLTPRLGSSYAPPGETSVHREHLQPDSLFSSRALYAEELNSSARPRPVGGTSGAQLRHLTQVGLSSRLNGYPAAPRSAAGQNGGWNHYHEDNFSRMEPEKEEFMDFPDYSSSSIFQMYRNATREPTAPLSHLDSPGVGYVSSAPPLETSPPTHSSASLIKAIREELLRLSQKQAALPSYHS